MTENDFNGSIISEFRAHGGKVGGQFAGAPLLLLHSTGARTGRSSVSPVMYLADEDRYVIFASKAGADTNPAWYHNLKAHPDTTIEVGTETLRVKVVELHGRERDELYARQAERYPGFGEYQARTKRVIPVLALAPVSS
jgi:deazaflavin-dependent oxidoreductase (nitroreductase family)